MYYCVHMQLEEAIPEHPAVVPESNQEEAQTGSWCEEEQRIVTVQLWNQAKEEAYKLLCSCPTLQPRLQTEVGKEQLKAFVNSMHPMMLSAVQANFDIDYENDPPSLVIQKSNMTSMVITQFIAYQKSLSSAASSKPPLHGAQSGVANDPPPLSNQLATLTNEHEQPGSASEVHDDVLEGARLQPLVPVPPPQPTIPGFALPEGFNLPAGFTVDDVINALQ